MPRPKLDFEEQPGTWMALVVYDFALKAENVMDPRYITSGSTGWVHLQELNTERDKFWCAQSTCEIWFVRALNDEEIDWIREAIGEGFGEP